MSLNCADNDLLNELKDNSLEEELLAGLAKAINESKFSKILSKYDLFEGLELSFKSRERPSELLIMKACWENGYPKITK